MIGVLIRERKGRSDTETQDAGHMKTVPETGVTWLQARECLASSHWKVKKGMADILPQSLQEESTLLTLISDL